VPGHSFGRSVTTLPSAVAASARSSAMRPGYTVCGPGAPGSPLGGPPWGIVTTATQLAPGGSSSGCQVAKRAYSLMPPPPKPSECCGSSFIFGTGDTARPKRPAAQYSQFEDEPKYARSNKPPPPPFGVTEYHVLSANYRIAPPAPPPLMPAAANFVWPESLNRR
jgi:hypothetical protein